MDTIESLGILIATEDDVLGWTQVTTAVSERDISIIESIWQTMQPVGAVVTVDRYGATFWRPDVR